MAPSNPTQPQSYAAHAPYVALLVETSTGWGRRLARGVTNYALKHGPWHLWIEPRGRTEAMRLPAGWEGHGVIARVVTQRLRRELAERRLPVVNVSGVELGGCTFPRVSTDHAASARLAVNHFLERGYRHFGYVGALNRTYVRAHAAAFERELTAHGAECEVLAFPDTSMTSTVWGELRLRLTEWLRGLHKPVGIFGWATSAGSQVLDACRSLGIVVPDEVAVLAGDDDPIVCNATSPPMSACVVASEQIGFHAAAMLDQMLHGRPLAETDAAIGPIGVTTRGSTDTLAIEDEELRRAVAFMRKNAYRPIRIDEVAYAVPMARRTLERKFREVFERSPAQELRRLRLVRASELLAHTDLSVAQVSDAAGFGTLEYMATAFKQEMGVTPLHYRRRTRAR